MNIMDESEYAGDNSVNTEFIFVVLSIRPYKFNDVLCSQRPKRRSYYDKLSKSSSSSSSQKVLNFGQF
jgi:hypothetical protein